MTLSSTEAPFTMATAPAFTASYQGLAGRKTAPLERIADATQVEVTARIISSRRSGRVIWLGLEADNGATAVASLDDAVGDTIAATAYHVGQTVRLRGTARTWPELGAPFIAVRRFLPVT
ncbi:hypothetical protein [Streptacidiphilus carbonis]|uniref:hypothetical protein n=1 Tax=Streptacidiphilus carbonis TaxID=105422 RepID=UPI0005AA3230|nr:hypothetical protein [Streptacidiphilus carbonis]